MKKSLIIFCSVFFVFMSKAQTKNLETVTIHQIPTSTEEFIELRNKMATTPQGGASMFILALKIYAENAELGKNCLIIASDASLLVPSKGGYKGFSIGSSTWGLIKRQIRSYPYLPNSYIVGSSAKNAYKVKLPFQVDSHSNPYSGNLEDGNFKIFIKCSGASSARPIRLTKNRKGYWKAKEFSSLLVGIKAPQKTLTEKDGDF